MAIFSQNNNIYTLLSPLTVNFLLDLTWLFFFLYFVYTCDIFSRVSKSFLSYLP